jgi:hypothetical protein
MPHRTAYSEVVFIGASAADLATPEELCSLQ